MKPGHAIVCLVLLACRAHAAPDRPTAQMAKMLEAQVLVRLAPPHTLGHEQARRAPRIKDVVDASVSRLPHRSESLPPLTVVDRRLHGEAGPIDVRVYTPPGRAPRPGVVYFHDGGFVLGDLELADHAARALAVRARCIVVSARYRQAPEHPFPAAHDDGVAAFRAVAAQAAELGLDPARLAVAGEGSGANVATGVAVSQKEPGEVQPVFQLLICPFVGNDLSTLSHARSGDGRYFVGNEDLAWYWRHELGPSWAGSRDPRALPIYAPADALRGLPPALVVVASLDPLLDEGREYGARLRAAGVGALVKQYDGVTHGFFGMGAAVDVARAAEIDAGNALRLAFERRGRRAAGRR